MKLKKLVRISHHGYPSPRKGEIAKLRRIFWGLFSNFNVPVNHSGSCLNVGSDSVGPGSGPRFYVLMFLCLQERIAKCHGTQCGFCTPGMVMSMYVLLRNHPEPTLSQLNDALGGRLYVCVL